MARPYGSMGIGRSLKARWEGPERGRATYSAGVVRTVSRGVAQVAGPTHSSRVVAMRSPDSLVEFENDLLAIRHIANLRGEVRQKPPPLVR